MGTFAGHAIPGAAFAAWGIWTYGRTLPRGHPAPSDTAGAGAQALPITSGTLESTVKIAVPVAGAIGELWWASWRLVDSSITNYQHATMYLFFALAGVADFLERGGRLPARSGHVALIGAFVMEAALFLGHPNPPGLESRLHLILVYVILAAAIALTIELRYPTRALTVLRGGLLILQGTWFWQIGYMLYLAEYQLTEHMQVMLSHLYLAWHALGVSILMIAAYVIARRSRTGGRA